MQERLLLKANPTPFLSFFLLLTTANPPRRPGSTAQQLYSLEDLVVAGCGHDPADILKHDGHFG